MEHLFFYCEKSANIWENFEKFCDKYCKCPKLSLENVLFNKTGNKINIISCLILIVKQYLYRQRCLKQEPNFYEVKSMVYKFENQEKYIATKNGTLSKHYAKWYGSTSSAHDLIVNDTVDLYTYVDNYLQNM